MTEFETTLVNSINSFYTKENIVAIAYRLYQAQYSKGQKIDIVSDSLNKNYYLAIEAKSMDITKTKTFNFKSRFDLTKDGFQLQREILFCRQSGRTGLLAIEIRNKRNPRECYFIPLELVYKKWKSGDKSIKIDYITENFTVTKRKGKTYTFNKNVFVEKYKYKSIK